MIERLTAVVDRWWDRIFGQPSGPADPSFPWRRHILTAVAIVGYAGVDAARRSLDGALAKIHPLNERGFGANDLHDGQAAAEAALAAWRRGASDFAGFLRWDGRQIAVVHTLLELVLVFFAAALLYAVVRFLRNELGRVRPPADAEDRWRPEPHALVLSVCTMAVLGYFTLGIVNQVLELTILARNEVDGAVAWVLRASHPVRRLGLLLTLIPAATTAAVLARNVWHPWQRLARAGSAYRVLGALAALHVALLLLSVPAEQSRDAIRLWSEHGWRAVWGVVATAGFSLALAAVALRLSTLRRDDAKVKLLGQAATVVLTAVGAGVVLVGLALHQWAHWGHGITALGAVVMAVGVLSLPIAFRFRDDTHGRRLAPPAPQTQVVVPAILALVPLAALEVATIEAAMPELILKGRPAWLAAVAVVIGGLGVFGYVAARRYGEIAYRAAEQATHEPGRRRAFYGVTGTLFGIGAVVAVWVTLDPWRHGVSVGVQALLGTFLVLLATGVGGISYLVEGRAIPSALDFVGLRRIPVVSAVVVWGLAGNAMSPDDTYHEIRVARVAPGVDRAVTVTDGFEQWVAANLPDATAAPEPTEARTVPGTPMVFVTAAGGGIRAATFTSLALECVFLDIDSTACAGDDAYAAADSWARVFVASGTSGGSVGIASAAATHAAGGRVDGWVAERLGTDLLSPELAWQLFVEAPNSLLGVNPSIDRAEILERSWERRFGDDLDGPGAVPFRSMGGPLLFLNGVNVTDGCRVNISPARTTAGGLPDEAAPAGTTAEGDCRRRRVDGATQTLDQVVARDLADYLCADEDVALSTAAFLSSRFPYVAPTGIVADLGQRRPDCATAAPTGKLSIGDGGYRDNTGAAALADVWSELEPAVAEFNRTHDQCIVPLLVEVDNGHSSGRGVTPPEPPIQLLAPLVGASSVFSSRDAGPIEAVSAEFSRELDPSVSVSLNGDTTVPRFVRLTLYDHPGVLAPLGWSLSTAAVEELQRQLDDVRGNADAVSRLGAWLAPGSLTCTVTPAGDGG